MKNSSNCFKNNALLNPGFLYGFCVLVSICFFDSSANAQYSSLRFSHLNTANGLSQSTVKCILKDKYGFMWFGTDDGLNKFDGYKFTVYKHRKNDPKSIGANEILSLFEDHQGNLWVGTNGGGLDFYDRGHDDFINYGANEKDSNSLTNRGVTSIYEDRQNNLWVGTFWNLNLFDRKAGKFKRYISDLNDPKSADNSRINCIFQDSQGKIWIGTDGGLKLFDRASGNYISYTPAKDDTLRLLSYKVSVIIEDSAHKLWIGTDHGLCHYDPASGQCKYFMYDPRLAQTLSNNEVSSLALDNKGRLWVGNTEALDLLITDDAGFVHFKWDANDENSLSNSSIVSLYYDPTGILWAGTFSGGINKYDQNLTYFPHYSSRNGDWNSLSFNVVSSFAEDQNGNIWVGTSGGALNFFNKSTNTFTRFNPDPKNKNSLASYSVLRLYHSALHNCLWIGMYASGLDRFDYRTRTFHHYTEGKDAYHLSNGSVYALLEDQTGMLWIGTNGGGLNILHPESGIIDKHHADPNSADSLSNDVIRGFAEDHKGHIWIATYSGGISEYDPYTKKFRTYNAHNSSLSSDNVIAIFADKNDNIWVGTQGSGLNELVRTTGRFVAFSEDQGLASNVINSITEDRKGFIWVSTNKGISRLGPISKTFKNFDRSNGLQGTEFNQAAGFTATSGELYFGGTNGFNVIDAENITSNHNKPNIAFTGLRLFNQDIPIGKAPLEQNINLTDKVRLNYDQSVFTIEYAALGYTNPESNQYAYLLEGFDKKWNYVGSQREATYTNLDPGTYKFHVKATNNEGLWGDHESILTIVVVPPFWKTWWFQTLLAISVIILVLSVYRNRIRKIKNQEARLKKLVLERTESLAVMTMEERKARKEAVEANIELEIKNRELEQFAYVASHDLQEPLRTISSFIELFQQQYKGHLDEKADKYLSFIGESSDRMKVLIHDLLEYSRIGRKLELSHVDCNQVFQTVCNDLGIAIQESKARIKAEPLPVLRGYSTEMKQLFQNLISNAIKFRKKDTPLSIDISATKTDGYWQFSFKDNGIGIDPKHKDRIFLIFQRLHTRNEYPGSGIGLSNCKKIVELHKGEIWVESIPGKGSTFYFTIPGNFI
jgi:signal transduction histidine kinase/ligand-binding sensor domain-containing protein